MLWPESLSGKCSNLHTVAASNNRDHLTRSLSSLPSGSTINCSPDSQALLEVTHQDHSIGIYIWVLFFANIPFVVNRTFNATPTERLQQKTDNGLWGTTKHAMPKCPSQFEGMRDFWTDTRMVFSYKHKFRKFWNAVQNFSAAQWLKFADTGRQIFTTGR